MYAIYFTSDFELFILRFLLLGWVASWALHRFCTQTLSFFAIRLWYLIHIANDKRMKVVIICSKKLDGRSWSNLDIKLLSLCWSFMVDMGISSNMMKSPSPKCHMTFWDMTIYSDTLNWLHYTNLLTYYRTGPYYRLWPHYLISGGFHRTLQRVRLANKGCFLLRTPGPVPFGTCICSNVETIFSGACHVYGLWISNIRRYFYFTLRCSILKSQIVRPRLMIFPTWHRLPLLDLYWFWSKCDRSREKGNTQTPLKTSIT